MRNFLLTLLLMSSVSWAQPDYAPTCNEEAFKKDLEADDRFVEHHPIDVDEIEPYMEKYEDLDGSNKKCATTIYTNYLQAYIEHCTTHECFSNIGGGCFHMAGQQFWLYKYAYNQCKP
ncbi:hypothetical protein [Teredinibacter sp. KSP-S5-2]|uniref:hypothetical protein n=1 Tax=Teredinibacter sp. KSP-S5-2 TaxID=3034506 RepID=UPI00293420D2|nr:hypothetical protein [Teredinibacter sp. KSP-S5-2]WNO10057.1 hypothetical protein P5V12_02615 [Teredinibacter sp. KSP-S5-2]